MGYLLGIDVGTTNTKAVLYDPGSGQIVATGHRPTVAYHPRPDWTEHDPVQIWRGVVGAIRDATAGRAADVEVVATASMGEAGVPIDARGTFLYPIIAWHDPRAEAQADWWRAAIGRRAVFQVTGQTIQPKFSVCKLLWLREHAPEVIRDAARWLCMEDLVNWKLSGEAATDYSIASRTMAFDQRRLGWSEEFLGRAGLPVALFPTPVPSGTPVGRVTDAAAEETGLRVGTVVATGGHDHLCGSLAAGVVRPGTILDSMGTAEGAVTLTGEYNPDDRLLDGGYAIYRHVVRGLYAVIGGLTASGRLLEWLVEQLWPEAGASPEARAAAFDAALAAASAVAPGSAGLFWLPDLRGAGSPREDPLSSAAIVGLTPAHGRGHLVRSALESLGYWLRDNVEALGRALPEPPAAEIIAVGAATRSPVLMQIRADVSGRPIPVPELSEAAALGAALLAGVGAGVFPDEAAAAASVQRPTIVYEPDPARAAAYQAFYEGVYLKLYPAPREFNHRVHELFWQGGQPR